MWQLYMVWSSVVGKHMKGVGSLYCTCVVCIDTQRCADMWHGKCLSQPNLIPLYHLLRLSNTFVSNNISQGLELKCTYNDKDH